MKTGTTTHYVLCRNRQRPDAACHRLPRCKKCRRVMYFAWGNLCLACEAAAANVKGVGK